MSSAILHSLECDYQLPQCMKKYGYVCNMCREKYQGRGIDVEFKLLIQCIVDDGSVNAVWFI